MIQTYNVHVPSFYWYSKSPTIDQEISFRVIINKKLNNFIYRTMSSTEAKSLRVGANSFLDHLTLVVETIEAFGPQDEKS